MWTSQKCLRLRRCNRVVCLARPFKRSQSATKHARDWCAMLGPLEPRPMGGKAASVDAPMESMPAAAADSPIIAGAPHERDGTVDENSSHRRRAESMGPSPAAPSSKSHHGDPARTTKALAGSRRTGSGRLRRTLNAINSLAAIKIKLFIYLVALLGLAQHAEAGFFTFYFPNIFKPKGYEELSEMIVDAEAQLNSTMDHFQDVQYFWGQLQLLDEMHLENNYPEVSACAEILPRFRDSAIEYAHIDYEFYIKPISLYHSYLKDFRSEWYPGKHDSKAALPREWEQKLLQTELQMKIDHLEKLVSEQQYKEKRQKLVDIWRGVRRSLDDSLECIYLRYAYRQIAEDINQLALETNLVSMRKAMSVLIKAYERIAKYKTSDEKIIKDIEEELQENERFTIKE